MLEKVVDVLKKTLELDEKTDISMQTKMEDIPEWDSFGQVSLLSELEKEFQIKFSFDEMIAINSVASILEILEKKNDERE